MKPTPRDPLPDQRDALRATLTVVRGALQRRTRVECEQAIALIDEALDPQLSCCVCGGPAHLDASPVVSDGVLPL
jgi:hypothetical protein